jgi:hypothetical protein
LSQFDFSASLLNKRDVRSFLFLAISVLTWGCASTPRQGVSRSDPYDSVRVDQMAANNVSGRVFERTIVCLNARRETHLPGPSTNFSVVLVTNVSLATLTNLTVTGSTNASRTFATNVVAVPIPAPGGNTGATEAVTPENAQNVALVATQTPNSTNTSVTSANNTSFSRASNQLVTTLNAQTLLSRQITTTTNNVSVTSAENQMFSIETNQVVTTLTNYVLTSVTNVLVTQPDTSQHDYYLYTEVTLPPDFTLQSGESLVLLVDGVRHGFVATNSQTAFVARKGFTSTLYKTTPEVLVAIANANEVKIRLKGNNSVIERAMSERSRENFSKFLLKYFTPAPSDPHVQSHAQADASSGRSR